MVLPGFTLLADFQHTTKQAAKQGLAENANIFVISKHFHFGPTGKDA
jgi:hypothetical protein